VAAKVLTHNGILYRDSMYTGMRPRAPSRVNAGNGRRWRRRRAGKPGEPPVHVVLHHIPYAVKYTDSEND